MVPCRTMRPQSDRPAGPSPIALLVLGIAGLVMLATGAPIPTVEAEAIGEVSIGPNEVVERELRIRIQPQAGSGADASSLYVAFIASSGLDTGYTEAATIGVTELPPDGATVASGGTLPLERCRAGCDLLYQVTVRAGPDVLPGSVARYRVDAELQYQSSPAAERWARPDPRRRGVGSRTADLGADRRRPRPDRAGSSSLRGRIPGLVTAVGGRPVH